MRSRPSRRPTLAKAIACVAVVTLPLSLMMVPACANSTPSAKGQSCVRASECADGLFCVNGICNDDLSAVDGGNMPRFDTGSEASANPEASTDAPGDSAPPPDGTPPPDTFMPPPDTTPPPDTFMPPPDTTPPPDTFVPPPDTAVVDTAPVD